MLDLARGDSNPQDRSQRDGDREGSANQRDESDESKCLAG